MAMRLYLQTDVELQYQPCGNRRDLAYRRLPILASRPRDICKRSGLSAPGKDINVYGYTAAAVEEEIYPGNCLPDVLYQGNGQWVINPTCVQTTEGFIAWSNSIYDNQYCPAEFAGQQGSPIMFDLDGLNFAAGFTTTADGVVFSLFPNQAAVQTAWTTPGRNIGFLVAARDAKGVAVIEPPTDWKVRDGKELFGNFTWQPPLVSTNADGTVLVNGKPKKDAEPLETNGFNALAEFDRTQYGGNGDGKIDDQDWIWPYLRLWIDDCHCGDSTKGRILTLKEAGIRAIGLKYTKGDRVIAGATERYVGTAELNDGAASVQIGDWYFEMKMKLFYAILFVLTVSAFIWRTRELAVFAALFWVMCLIDLLPKTIQVVRKLIREGIK